MGRLKGRMRRYSAAIFRNFAPVNGRSCGVLVRLVVILAYASTDASEIMGEV